MSAAMVRRKAGFPSYPSSQYAIPGLQENRKPPKIEPSVATSEVNDLPESIYTEVPDLLKSKYTYPNDELIKFSTQIY